MEKVEKKSFLPLGLGKPFLDVVPEYAINEPEDLNICKLRIDRFIDSICEGFPAECIHVSGNYFLSIKPFLVNGKYRGLIVKNQSKMPKNLIFISEQNKFHK